MSNGLISKFKNWMTEEDEYYDDEEMDTDLEENEEDMETSVYRDSCLVHDFNCIANHFSPGSRNTVLDGIRRESRIY